VSELAALSRAHQLFGGTTRAVPVDARLAPYDRHLERAAAMNIVGEHELYRSAVDQSRDALRSNAATDAAVTATLAAAHRDYADAHVLTKGVLDEARADTAVPDNPIAQREALRRRVARLRAQQAHVVAAGRKARRHRSRWRPLSYRMLHRGMPPANSRAGVAVRAALSRLGSPYVWGATGPDRFDCSGLTQWAYARAGIHLDRTTYQQIYDGIAIPRAQVRPGDLVFPSAGHVQMAIGNNLVVEAPHSGATVRISRLGDGVQIRRPLG
jgi:peptidoglycan DL-endopeptidase CwlO